ncbi:MAG: cystathionine gamma-lyase [Solirubrobacteraceae bacterium]|nr:cystathionine gamma-lyase [Solirubrobacteraceae bacterium]
MTQSPDDTTPRGPGTLVVHAGLPAPVRGEPYLPGPVFAAPLHYAGEWEGQAPFYAREGHPTIDRWEAALGELEAGEAIAFASGMAAAAAVLFTVLDAGDVLVLPDDCYFSVRQLAEQQLERRGVHVRRAPTDEAALRALLPGARLLWLETPSNPMLREVDLAALAADAHAEGALVVVDNTLLTPHGRRALDHGADVVISSDTKQLTGHSDLLLGHVATRDAELAEHVREWRTTTGAVPGPFETWLAHRSLATLAVRAERQQANAAALAALLAERGDVAWSRWPGAGCVVSFDLGTAERATRFLNALKLVAEATSFGGVHSSAERRARWGGDDVSPGLIRLSVGLEDEADLLGDVARALEDAAGDA